MSEEKETRDIGWNGGRIRILISILVAGVAGIIIFICDIKNNDEIYDEEKERNFFLLITIDTLNPMYLGCWGDPETKTPVIDGLSKMGFQFSQCHTAINLTTPSHASIITGVYPLEHEVYNNALPVSDRFETLGELFSEGGYITAAAVSSFQLDPEYSNLGQGFDDFFRCVNLGLDGAETTSRIIGWLDQYSTEDKKFAWLHYMDCHAPYVPPRIYKKFYTKRKRTRRKSELSGEKRRIHSSSTIIDTEADSLMKTREFLKLKPWSDRYESWLKEVSDEEWAKNQYRGTISEVDHHIERIILKLAETGELERTVIVITADHGESLGEHGIYYAHWGPYEPSIDVPLIIRDPAFSKSGIIEKLTSTLDVPPTLVDIAGMPVPESYQGISLKNVMIDSKKPVRDFLVVESNRQMAVTVRNRKGKLIVPLYSQPMHPREKELYYINEDLAEKRNLINYDKKLYARLDADLNKWALDILERKATVVPKPTHEAATLEKLEALGYLSKH